MKKIHVIFGCISMLFLSACEQTNKDDEKQQVIVKPATIDLLNGSTPESFTATTIDGSKFNSDDLKGKYWLIFVYDKRYLVKSESFDMVTELNSTAKLYGNKIPMIGIINGFSDDEAALKNLLNSVKLNIKQIDNTRGPNKEELLNDNIFCTPAKILIDPEGKVIHNGCGGNFEPFHEMMDEIIKNNKL